MEITVTFALCVLKDIVEKMALDLKVPVDEKKCLTKRQGQQKPDISYTENSE